MKNEDAEFLRALEKGVALFNEAKFMEAYEVWEERWAEDAGDGADLLQGLLQVAVGLAKLEGGNPKGTIKLLDKGMKMLDAYRPQAYDIDIEALVEIIGEYRTRASDIVGEGRVGSNTLMRAEPVAAEDPKTESSQVPWWKRVFGGKN